MKGKNKQTNRSRHTIGSMVAGDPRLQQMLEIPADERLEIMKEALRRQRAASTSTPGKE